MNVHRFGARIGLVVVAGATLAFVLGDVLGHPGGLAKSDGCHNQRADGAVIERHYHAPGTRDRAGTCEERDGHRYRVRTVADPEGVAAAELAADAAVERARAVEAELARVREDLNRWQIVAGEARANARAEVSARVAAENAARDARAAASIATTKLADVTAGRRPCGRQAERLRAQVGAFFGSSIRPHAERLLACLDADREG